MRCVLEIMNTCGSFAFPVCGNRSLFSVISVAAVFSTGVGQLEIDRRGKTIKIQNCRLRSSSILICVKIMISENERGKKVEEISIGLSQVHTTFLAVNTCYVYRIWERKNFMVNFPWIDLK